MCSSDLSIKVVVVGDFNARVGELSNVIHIPDADISEEGQVFRRTSKIE